jgi:hypothetical protein
LRACITPLRSIIAKRGRDKAALKSECRQNATVPSHLETRRIGMIAMNASNDLEERHPGIRP